MRFLFVLACALSTLAYGQTDLQELNTRAGKVLQRRAEELQLTKHQLSDQSAQVRASVNDEAIDFLAMRKAPKLEELEAAAQKVAGTASEIAEEVFRTDDNRQLMRRLMVRYRLSKTPEQLRQTFLETYTVPYTPAGLVRLWILQSATGEISRYCPSARDCARLYEVGTGIQQMIERIR